ncbi:FAD-dependent monooxygenase [Xanthomonas campestris]|uniref:FAD-dependent monooxygenase n=1 Tax=Xanthomonas campestris TaxID=339 RepID=UPI002358C72F|nr:FAD-dependent monooxygenase [Xanthomonas campestris]MDC8748545.1 FAD-dependent monooxygenase [Xanthomonas campestris]
MPVAGRGAVHAAAPHPQGQARPASHRAHHRHGQRPLTALGTPRYDVVVLGAGPAGASCALALARAGVERLCLVDGGSAAGAAIGETIPPDARLLLQQLGLWSAFLGDGHLACVGSCASWGSPQLGFNDFVLNPHGAAWHLDRARFDRFLRAHAHAAGVEGMPDARLVDAAQDADGDVVLTLASRDGGLGKLRARMVVDATGQASALARRLGARRRELDRLSFVYGFFDATAAASPSRLTLLEASADGWWYAALLPGRRIAVAFATDAESVKRDRLGSDHGWLSAVLRTRHLAQRLDGCRYLAGQLTARVAASFMLDRVAGPRWLAIGDAATSFDPLAAQGIYKAISDGLQAAASVSAALASDSDLSDDYASAVQARFAEYLINRNHFYNLERRWPDSAFWARRQARLDLAAVA